MKTRPDFRFVFSSLSLRVVLKNVNKLETALPDNSDNCYRRFSKKQTKKTGKCLLLVQFLMSLLSFKDEPFFPTKLRGAMKLVIFL